MKITETNSDELQINENGYTPLIVGLLLAVGGVALGLWGYAERHSLTNDWIVLVAAGIFSLLGIVIFLTASSRRVILRRAGQSEIITTKILTKKATTVTFAADQIETVNFESHEEYERTTDSDGRTQETRRRVSSILVRLKDTTEIILASSRGNGLTLNGVNLGNLGKAPLFDEATKIANFFGKTLTTSIRNGDVIGSLSDVVSAVEQGMNGVPTQPVSVVPPVVSQALPPLTNGALPQSPIQANINIGQQPEDVSNITPLTPPTTSSSPVQSPQPQNVSRSISVPPRE